MTTATFHAGASQIDITPNGSVPLWGYPLVPRMSTGVHDRLYASALYMNDGHCQVLFIGTDLIFIARQEADQIRQRLAQILNMPTHAILISASHTHSGPPTVKCYWGNTPGKPPMLNADDAYCQQIVDAAITAGCNAARSAVPARVGLAHADGSALGTNRRDPKGPAIGQMPVLAVRDLKNEIIGIMVVCNMHPTVLHEDSTLISGDFPGLARMHLQTTLLKNNKPLIYHMGAAGNQSPRHVVRSNTMLECDRLGKILGQAIERAVASAHWHDHLTLSSAADEVVLPVREVGDMKTARAKLEAIEQKLQSLRQNDAPKTTVRTAECDWFGAQERVLFIEAAESGLLEKAVRMNMPAPIQRITLGEKIYIGWPGEVFVEFALQVMQQFPQASIITCANSELQGYLVTAQAVAEDAYEANNALFASPQSGELLVQATTRLLKQNTPRKS